MKSYSDRKEYFKKYYQTNKDRLKQYYQDNRDLKLDYQNSYNKIHRVKKEAENDTGAEESI